MARLAVNGKVYHLPPFAPVDTPAVGASVEIYDYDLPINDQRSDLIFSTMTDSEGTFSGLTSDSSVWLDSLPDIPALYVVVKQDSHSWSVPLPVPPIPNVSADLPLLVPAIFVPWGPGPIPWETGCNPVAVSADLRQQQIKLKAGIYDWAYDLADEIANCKDPIPPEENNTPRFSKEYASVLASGFARKRSVQVAWLTNPFDSLNDYRRFFGRQRFRAPGVLDRYPGLNDVVISDADFAAQRLAGANPMMLRRVVRGTGNVIPRRFGGGYGALRERLLPIADLTELLQLGRLYLADYGIVRQGMNGSKYMPSPVALFGVIDGRLKPLAIQIERAFDAADNPVFTPADADLTMWNIAKIMVQIADFAVHELKYHLYETHLAMEPFAVALARNMAMWHPISMLLGPHFHGMIFKNAQARHTLIAPGGQVESIIGLPLTRSRTIVRRAAQAYRFDEAALPAFLARNGLDDPIALPGYSYRDDALLIWEAIKNFVTDFVNHCYVADADVATCDTELQNWLGEVRSPNGGRLNGVPEVTTRAGLVDVLTQIIFTCSAQHSAVNFAQYDYFAFVPNQPGSAYARPLPNAQGPGVTNLGQILPPSGVALEQTHLMWQLAIYHYDQLGHYDITFPEPYATDVKNFRDKLIEVEEMIRARNEARTRSLRYTYLQPASIINSISV